MKGTVYDPAIVPAGFHAASSGHAGSADTYGMGQLVYVYLSVSLSNSSNLGVSGAKALK
jgi:hypothetical protein